MEQKSFRDVRLAKKGHKDAFIRLIRQHESSLYQVARAILQTDAECADALQHAILKAYEQIRTLKRAESFKTWIMRLVIAECHRIQDQRKKIIPLETKRKPPEVAPDCDTAALLAAIDRLEHDLRVVIQLYYHGELSLDMIAAALNLDIHTARSRLYEARERLAHLLERPASGGGGCE